MDDIKAEAIRGIFTCLPKMCNFFYQTDEIFLISFNIKRQNHLHYLSNRMLDWFREYFSDITFLTEMEEGWNVFQGPSINFRVIYDKVNNKAMVRAFIIGELDKFYTYHYPDVFYNNGILEVDEIDESFIKINDAVHPSLFIYEILTHIENYQFVFVDNVVDFKEVYSKSEKNAAKYFSSTLSKYPNFEKYHNLVYPQIIIFKDIDVRINDIVVKHFKVGELLAIGKRNYLVSNIEPSIIFDSELSGWCEENFDEDTYKDLVFCDFKESESLNNDIDWTIQLFDIGDKKFRSLKASDVKKAINKQYNQDLNSDLFHTISFDRYYYKTKGKFKFDPFNNIIYKNTKYGLEPNVDYFHVNNKTSLFLDEIFKKIVSKITNPNKIDKLTVSKNSNTLPIVDILTLHLFPNISPANGFVKALGLTEYADDLLGFSCKIGYSDILPFKSLPETAKQQFFDYAEKNEGSVIKEIGDFKFVFTCKGSQSRLFIGWPTQSGHLEEVLVTTKTKLTEPAETIEDGNIEKIVEKPIVSAYFGEGIYATNIAEKIIIYKKEVEKPPLVIASKNVASNHNHNRNLFEYINEQVANKKLTIWYCGVELIFECGKDYLYTTRTTKQLDKKICHLVDITTADSNGRLITYGIVELDGQQIEVPIITLFESYFSRVHNEIIPIFDHPLIGKKLIVSEDSDFLIRSFSSKKCYYTIEACFPHSYQPNLDVFLFNTGLVLFRKTIDSIFDITEDVDKRPRATIRKTELEQPICGVPAVLSPKLSGRSVASLLHSGAISWNNFNNYCVLSAMQLPLL